MNQKTSIAVKICGITKADQAKTIVDLGADAIGIIGVAQSPRYINEKVRREIFSVIQGYAPKIERVWVTSNISDLEIEKALIGEGIPSTIQLHGNESLKRCIELKENYPKLKFWKAIRIASIEDLDEIKRFEGFIDAFLLDSWNQQKLGGTGKQIPLKILEKLSIKSPWWLAGGISAESITSSLLKFNPHGIDASSLLETSPGIKNMAKVKLLIERIKSI